MTTTNTGPLIPRRRLGAAFRELRESRGETLQQTAKVLMFSPSKLSRIENGLGGEPHPRDVRDILAHFAVDGTADGHRLEALAEQSRVPGWWQVPPYEMPSRLDTFISYESAASRIEAYVPTVVPGLLQTREYARECIHQLVPHLDHEAVEHQVEIRMRRQQELNRRELPPTQLYAIPETVLHRRVGSPDAMREQLETILATFDNPLIDLHVIPFSAGIYEAIEVSTLTIFTFDEEGHFDIASLERVRSVQYMDRPESVEKYRRVVSRLADHWLDRSESRAFIERVRNKDDREIQ